MTYFARCVASPARSSPSFGSEHHPFVAASLSCRALVRRITRERVTVYVTRVEDRSEAECQRLKRSSVPRWRGPRRRGCKSPLVLATTVVCSIRLVPVVTTGCWKSLESLLALPLVFPRSPKRTASTAEPPRTRVFHRQFFEEIAYCRFYFVSAAIFCLSGCRRRGDLDGLGTISRQRYTGTPVFIPCFVLLLGQVNPLNSFTRYAPGNRIIGTCLVVGRKQKGVLTERSSRVLIQQFVRLGLRIVEK